MWRIALWRLLAVLPIMVVVSFLAFVALSLNDVDPADFVELLLRERVVQVTEMRDTQVCDLEDKD